MNSLIKAIIPIVLLASCAVDPVVEKVYIQPASAYVYVEVHANLKPVTEYPLYFQEDTGTVYGISGEQIEPITFED